MLKLCMPLLFKFAQSGKKYSFIRKMQQLFTNPNKIMFVLAYIESMENKICQSQLARLYCTAGTNMILFTGIDIADDIQADLHFCC